MIRTIGIAALIISLAGCSPKLSAGYSSLSSAEKTWVIFHPFKAKKAYPMAAYAIKVADSLAASGRIDRDTNGGTYDAFKHCFWMATTAQLIGEKGALGLGKAHERGNFQSFKQRKKEDGQAPDLSSSMMDSHNNQVGAQLGSILPKEQQETLIDQLLEALNDGRLRVLLKDEQGNFLDCSKKIIPVDSLKNNWDTKKCVVPSMSK